MKTQLHGLALIALAIGLAGCATNSVKQTWKSPSYDGHAIQKVSVVAVAGRQMVRVALENRFMRELRKQGQDAINTHELIGLSEIKADKEAAAARVRAAGSDAVLIVRMVDQATYARIVPTLNVEYVSGFGAYAWHDYFLLAYGDMGTIRGTSIKDKVYLDSTLFDLKTGQRLWSTLTLSVVKEDVDRLEVADDLVAKVVSAMRKDGFIHH